MKYLIIDLKTKAALYGVKEYSLLFETEKEAQNIAEQFFTNDDDFVVVGIKIKPPIAIANLI